MMNLRGGRSARILLSTACLALALTSCGDGDDDGEVRIPVESGASSPAESPAAAEPEDDSSLDLAEAAAVALEEVDRSSLLSIETEEARTIWEATVVTRNGTEHEMLIAKADGELYDGPTRKVDDAEDKAENRARIRAAEIDYREAARAMAEAVPDATLMELNLESENRRTVWEGNLRAADGRMHSVTVDAGSGDVLRKHADAEDDD